MPAESRSGAPSMALGSLPAQPGPLVGRAAEIEFARARLLRDDVRLLTLVGPAGTGKTRLAIDLARETAPIFEGSAWFVDLAPLTDPDLVPSAIAHVRQVRAKRDESLRDLVKENLANVHALLVLDNFEQLLPAASQLVELLQACPKLKLLVTSRSALHLRWEHEMPVPPLEVPRLDQLPPPDALADVPSVALFVQRTQRVDPTFRLDASNAAAVAEICVRLDGLPLAIELAAARTRVLPPPALLSRLDARFSVLAGGAHDQPLRQRTLRAALDWSYGLLSPSEQALFRRLGVFVGSFGLEAVSEVCDPGNVLDLDLIESLESLVEQSLVRNDATGATEPRFRLLETIRAYAVERLDESGERDDLRRRHAVYYLNGADVALARIGPAQQALWLRSLDMEHANLRAALDWCQEVREPDLGLQAAALLTWFWTVRGHLAEGRARLEGLLRVADAGAPSRAEALRAAASLAMQQGDYPAARAMFEASLAMRREIDHAAGLLGPLSGLGAVAMQQGDLATAQACFEEALAIQRSLNDRLGMAESLNSLANLAHERGDLAAARALYEQSQTFNVEIGYRADVVLHNLGVVAQEEGDLATARLRFEDSAAIKRALGDTTGLALSLAKLGEVAAQLGDRAAARRYLVQSLNLQRELGDKPVLAFVLERFAMAAAQHGLHAQAVRLAAAGGALRESIGAPLNAAAQASLDRRLAPSREALRSDAERVWQEGRAMSIDEAIACALDPDPVPTNEVPASPLTPRERQVAALVARGLTNRQIAVELVVSERTADVHVSNILGKLGLTSRSQLAVWSVQHGIA